MKIIKNSENYPPLPNELEIELSLIESGMIISEINDNVVFIIKDSVEMTSSLTGIKSLNLNFTYIDRPEFPSVNTELKLKTAKNLSIKYDYFFNYESEYEMNLLTLILNQREISLFLFSDILIKKIALDLEEDEILKLSGILDEFKS